MDVFKTNPFLDIMPNCGKNGHRGDALVVGQVYDVYSGDQQQPLARVAYKDIISEQGEQVMREWIRFSYHPKQVDEAGNEVFFYVLYYDPADPVGGPPWPYEAYKYCPVAEYDVGQLGQQMGNMQIAPRNAAIGAEDEDMNGGRRRRKRGKKTRKSKRRARKTKRSSK